MPNALSTIFLPFAIGYYLSYLLRTVNAVVSPSLTEDLALDPAALGLLTSTYFLAFGLAQIPVGIALDRFGPRRVEAALLVLASLGAAIFASGDSLLELGLGRGLIGLGVSACLMGALKGLSLWYPPERLSSMTGFIMAAGAMGALTASSPLEALLPVLGWRGVFWAIAVAALVSALLIHRMLPDVRSTGQAISVGDAFRSAARIYASPPVIRLAASSVFFVGGFMALQSLWAVPWLMHVSGLKLAEAARTLLVLNIGMLAGQLLIGFCASRLGRHGVRPLHFLQWGYGGLLLVQLSILLGFGPTQVLWFLLGALSAVNSQAYLTASAHFSREWFGRVSAAVNLMVFGGAFAVQWGLGLALDRLQLGGLSTAAALRWMLAGLIVLQAFSLLPLLRPAGVPGTSPFQR